MTLRPLCALAALGLLLAACGGEDSDRFQLRTPGANTGEAVVAPPTPSPRPTPTATPKAKAAARPVTREEKRIIRGWSDALRHGHVGAASKYFAIPSLAVNNDPGTVLGTRELVVAFNRTLPCGAKLTKARRGAEAHWVVGTFVLTERPGGACGTGTGEHAFVAFMIGHHHITQWVRVEAADANATPTPTPTPTPQATDSTLA